MKKRLVGILLGLILLLVLGLVVFELVRPSEPVYVGTTVTGWIRVLSLEQADLRDLNAQAAATFVAVLARTGRGATAPAAFNTNRPSYVPRVRDSRRGGAMDAFRKIGAPAIPYLAKALRKQDSVFRSSYLRVYLACPQGARRFLPQPSIDADCIRTAAALALRDLPELAKPAFPALVEALSDSDPTVRRLALEALRVLSERDLEVSNALSDRFLKPGLSPAEVVATVEKYSLRSSVAARALIPAATNTDHRLSEAAIDQLRLIGPSAAAATPCLVTALRNANRTVRCRACQALAAIQPAEPRLLPLLFETLNDPDKLVRANAANALAAYGPNASGAVPRLSELYPTSQDVERHCVERALKLIDPVAAAKLGVK